MLGRKVRGRIRLTSGDRQFFVDFDRRFPSILKVIWIVRPETLVRWHRAGFAATGAGSLARREVDRQSEWSCGHLYAA